MTVDASDAELPVIGQRYLLLTLIPCYRDERGAIWLDRLWHHDFVEHFRYLRRVALAAPVVPKDEGPTDLVRVDVPSGRELTVVPLPRMETTLQAIAGLPRTARVLWRAIGEADIVHSGVAGWPLPVGWIANPMALARHRPLVVMVESAPWRTRTGSETPGQLARAWLTEALARLSVRHADLNLFTQPDYARSLGGGATGGRHVTPAAWIGAADIVSEEEARASWVEKRTGPVRLLFAARLLAEKGVGVLLDALEELESRGVAARVDIIGEGVLRGRCAEAARRLSTVELRVLDPVPYGRPFFELLRQRHAVLVPNLGDEQPRIVFDAYAQAVPVIASDTDGLRPYVQDGETGWLVPTGDPEALARAIERALSSAEELERLGMAALRVAPDYTHRAMHEARWRILLERFGAGPGEAREGPQPASEASPASTAGGPASRRAGGARVQEPSLSHVSSVAQSR